MIQPMLKIDWKRGPNLPQGFQDSDAGFIGTTLITVGGFCGGSPVDNDRKPGMYPRGFLNKVWGFDTAQEEERWFDLPDIPGPGRQGLMAIVFDDQMYVWGGFSYSSPYCYKEGYKLSQKGGQFIWQELPPLPWPLTASGICSIGTKIYMFGGGDYSDDFTTYNDRSGENPRLGACLIVFDTEDEKSGWTRLSDCPGTPRLNFAMATVKGKIYVIGGGTGHDHPGNTGPAYRDSDEWTPYCSVVDNWCYDPASDSWTRLGDLPISSGSFPDNQIVYKDRYLLLVGGHQYRKVANPDGTIRDKYGTASQCEGRGEYFNDVFVYDTGTGRFGTADPLPINNCMATTVVRGDEIFTIGGECDAREIEGEYYGHHPDLFLRGRITDKKPSTHETRTPKSKRLIKKLGTIDCDMVETTPVVFQDRLYRFEYVRPNYKPNKTGDSYFRFINVETGESTPAFATGYHLGSAYVQGDTVFVYGVHTWGVSVIQVFWSRDMSTWSSQAALTLPGWGIFNTSVCKGRGRYIMAFEIDKPLQETGVPFTIRFAESHDLLNWQLTPPECVYSKDRYTACPALRYVDGYYYMIYLEARPGPTYETHIVRSSDLVHWKSSPLNPVLRHSAEDKIIANPALAPEQRGFVANAVNVNNSDVDLCEFKGETIIMYSWGDQRGTEFLAQAVYKGTLKDFFHAFFPDL